MSVRTGGRRQNAWQRTNTSKRYERLMTAPPCASPEGDFGAVVGGGVPDSQQHRAVRQHVCPSVYVSQAQSAQPLTHLLLETGVDV